MSQTEARTAESQSALTPAAALQMLKEGNLRFHSGKSTARDYLEQVKATAEGQYPFAVVLGCIDSRVPPELVFDQGIGDIFSARVAGNVVDPHILGSMEFACRLAGSKLIVVLGHTNCGAVAGVLRGAELGHLSGLLEEIGPAIDASGGGDDLEEPGPEVMARVSRANVERMVARLREESSVLSTMETEGKIRIVGAVYRVETGEVDFLDE